MKNTKKCENCIWFDQCAQEVTCDDYYPASVDKAEVDQIAEYENDLQDRHAYYQELVEEQNS